MSNMIETLIDIGATLDWITPLIDFIKDAKNGPRHSFFVDRYAGWSANDIERMLKQRDIEMWGIVFFRDSIAFDVKEADASRAQNILQSNNVPIIQGVLSPPAGMYKAQLYTYSSSSYNNTKSLFWLLVLSNLVIWGGVLLR